MSSRKIDYSAVNDATDRLAKFKADEFFPDLLSNEQMSQIQENRIKKQKKLGYGKVKDVRESDFIIKDGGYEKDADGNIFSVDDFDIARYMTEAEDADTGTLHDLKIDTRDLKLADNFYDYAFEFRKKAMRAGRAHPPWARQMWVGAMLFGEVCPKCSDPDWLDIENVPVNYKSINMPEHLCFLNKGKCPKCKRKKWDLIQNHGLRNYTQYAGVIGQRGSKSSLTALLASYLTHRILKFPQLSSLSTAMQASTELTGTFVSLTYGKAAGVLWTPFKHIIEEECDWFTDYFELMDHYKAKYGREMYKLNAQFMTFHDRNLRIYPSGPKSQTLRGDTRVFGALDELGLFPLPSGDDQEDETSDRANADEAHKSLYNSLGTASAIYENLLREGYQTAPPPMLFNVSSPYSIRDKMMRLLRQSKTEEGRSILGVQLATWEMNPTFTRQSQFIVDAYNSNYEKAERDFGANPPTVHSRFVPVDSYKTGVFIGGKNSHQFTYQYDQAREVYGKIELVRNHGTFPSIMAMDAGHTNNSFCVGGGHYNFDTGKTHITTLLECIPTEGRSVNFNLIYGNVILPLAKDLNAVGLSADQWQGIDILYRIKADMGLNPLKKPRCLPKQYSPKRKDFDAVVEMMRSGNLIVPSLSDKDRDWILEGNIDNFRTDMFGKPVHHLMLQMNTVMDTGEGRAPTKGEKMTDDLFRTLVLLVTTIHNPKVMERLEEARKFSYSGNRVRMPMAAFAGRSGGSSGAMNFRR
jgi:hypothetical protein